MTSIYEIREAAKGLGDQVNRADSHVSVTDCAAARELGVVTKICLE
ncbi:hypothetical protein [Corynebacterium accolens]